MITIVPMALERLQKLIASTGILSRRKAEIAITEGRVKLNGKTVTALGTKADSQKDKIHVDGSLLDFCSKTILLAFHKPKKVVTTKHDPQGRKTVMDYIPKKYKVNPIGRLDFETEGLLLFTNDGDLANLIMHPRNEIKKTYEAIVEGRPSKESIKELSIGVTLKDGKGKFLSVRLKKRNMTSSEFEVVVGEGRNRFVRRMFAAIGHPVTKLKRTKIGSLTLGDLPLGKLVTIKASKFFKP